MDIDASNPLAEEGAEMGLVTGDQRLAIVDEDAHSPLRPCASS